MSAKIQVKLVRSPIGRPALTKAQIAGLGLKRPNTTVLLPDTPQVRGMLAKVPHMVEWAPAPGSKPSKASGRRKPAAAKAAGSEATATGRVTTRAKKEKKDDVAPVESSSGI